jgi:hypothetical protein
MREPGNSKVEEEFDRTWPSFRDVRLGGNAVDASVPGHDLVTGFGSPNIDNLARGLVDMQMGAKRR